MKKLQLKDKGNIRMAKKISVLGIDHGGNGAFALYDGLNHVIWRMPALGSVKGQKDLLHLLEDIKTDFNPICFIEEAHFVFGKGKGHSKFMANFGKMEMGLVVSELRYQIIKAKLWKEEILRFTSKDKQAAIDYVSRKYPEVDLTPGKIRKPHDGITDAVCIAEYGYRITSKSVRRSRRR
jgi:crossover junction endodeoxyribonuclease RuvC